MKRLKAAGIGKGWWAYQERGIFVLLGPDPVKRSQANTQSSSLRYPGETILVEEDKHPFRTTVLQKTRTETKDPTDLAA